MKQIKAKIIENKKIAEGFYKMRVESPYLSKNSKPGQFVEVKCSDEIIPLLRRPLGVHKISKNRIEVLYEVVGRGTELLSKKKSGGFLDIIGPLGNGFMINQPTSQPANQQTILIAGGVGVAPLAALADELRQKKYKVDVIIGARTKSHIMCEEDFKSMGCSVHVATEDGSKGYKGLATDLLVKELNQQTSKPANQQTIIYACGPTAMLKAVAKIAEAKHIPCQVSMEERMACGIGVCLGCPVKVKGPVASSQSPEYKMVCKDGPVFDAKEIAW